MLTTPYKVLVACSTLLLLAALGYRVTELLGGGEPLVVVSAQAGPGALVSALPDVEKDRPDPADDLRPPLRRRGEAPAPVEPEGVVAGVTMPAEMTPSPNFADAPAPPPATVGSQVPTLVTGRQPGEDPAGRNATLAGAQEAEQVAPDTQIYVVRSGDSLERIARRTLGDANRWGRIAELNPGVDPIRLQVGDRLIVPAGAATDAGAPSSGATSAASSTSTNVHVVEPGDSLSVIALRYYGDSNRWKVIYEANRDVMSSPDGLRIGTRLTIPAR